MHASVADIYTDFQGLAELKAQARQDQSAGADAVARQFESLLMHMMLKSMRQASLGEGLLDNDQSEFYRDMYDQQLALHLAEGGGLGLADVIRRQLGVDQEAPAQPSLGLTDYRGSVVTPAVRPIPLRATKGPEVPEQTGSSLPVNSMPESDPADWSSDDFVRNLWPWAREAAAKLGLTPPALLAQAALETGWGKHLMRLADGSPSHNLFGIKADQRWDGKSVGVDTLEYEQGVVVRQKAFFRVYDSFRDSFQDYVDFLQQHPRYQEALEATGDSQGFFTALQRVGYATDPNYADKINALLTGQNMAVAVERLKADVTPPL